jgi:hypothetical protein
MSNATSRHPDEATLLRFSDQDLSAAEIRDIEEHLAGCAACRGELAAVRETLGEIERFHETVMKAALPRPPRAWGRPIWSALANPEPAERRLIAFPVKRAMAIAAAIVVAVVVVRWVERPITVSAAELLRKAEVQEREASNVRRRIRIRWKGHSWMRPGRLDASLQPESVAPVLRGMLVSAGFDWEDPLSASAFSRWRKGLPEWQDAVRNDRGSYVVTTSTPAGALREASLTLRAGDLHAVSATLKYRSQETLEMMEVPGDANEVEIGKPRPPVPELIPRAPETAAPTAGAAEEVQVIAALHRIGADLGEPVDVLRTPEGIHVSGSGLNAVRQDQIRAAVADIPGVRVAFEANDSHRPNGAELPPRTAAPADAANPLLDELRAAAANAAGDPADALIDATDRAVQRSYALAALARRFPQPGESALAERDRAVVRRTALDHVEALSAAVSQITTLLAAWLPLSSASVVAPAHWQETAEGILAAAQGVDQEVNASSNGDLDGRKARLATALARLRSLVKVAPSQLQ